VDSITSTPTPASERPIWQTTPCPAWCVEKHRDLDHPDDRIHWSDWHGTKLTTMDTENVGSPDEPAWALHNATVNLFQNYREVEPRITLVDDMHERCSYAMHLSLDEAEQIAFKLLDLVRKGRGQESPKILPFDSHGRCVTRDCVVCHAEKTA